jgi:DNA-binding CsgD family transcriptional regulator
MGLRDQELGEAMTIRGVETRSLRRGAGELESALAGSTPVLVTDADGRITKWNRAAERFFERQGAQIQGRRCYDVVGGRDVFGNRFCHERCALMSMGRRGQKIEAFELSVAVSLRPKQPLQVSVFPCGESLTSSAELVHRFQPIEGADRLAQALGRLGGAPKPPATCSRGPVPLRPEPREEEPPLSSREREVLRWVTAGLQNKEVAEKLNLSPATVRNHIHNILEKLEVHSKLEAVSLAFRRGWVAAPSSGAGTLLAELT